MIRTLLILACVLVIACTDDPMAYSAALGMENEELREEVADMQESLREHARKCGALYAVVNLDGTIRCAQLIPGMNGRDWTKLTGKK